MSRRLPPLRELLAELVAVPSASCTDPRRDQGNRAVAERLAGWLEDLGFRATVRALEGRPDKVNLIATRGPGTDGLVLAGHTDTVPCDPERWASDPWTLTERAGRVHGLGVCDMKGFFPLVLEAVRRVDDAQWRAPLTVVATAEEETSMAGARALGEGPPLPARAAVIGEPTGLRPIHRHKGMMMQAVRIRGRSGHSSDPALGRSALDAMHRVLTLLVELREELAAGHRDPAFEVPVPTLNLGRIEGGDNPNRICGRCDLEFDLRSLPGMANEALRAEIGRRLAPVAAAFGVDVRHEPLFAGIEPFANRDDAELVRLAVELTGGPAGAVGFATEAPFFQALGLDTVVLGPGDVACAHRPDECLELARIDPAVDLLEHLIARYCLGDPESQGGRTGP